MVRQSGLSMKERLLLFHRRFPSTRISLKRLRAIYKEAGVKIKKIKWRGVSKASDPPDIPGLRDAFRERVTGLESQGYELIYCDETWVS